MPSYRSRSKTPGAAPGEGTGVQTFLPLQSKNDPERFKLVKETRTDPKAYGQDRAAGVVTGASEPRLAARPVQDNHPNPIVAQRKPTKGKLTDPRLNKLTDPRLNKGVRAPAARPPATPGTQKSAQSLKVNNNHRPTTPANNQSRIRDRSRSQNLRDRSRSQSQNRRTFIDDDDDDELSEDDDDEPPSPAGRIFTPSTLPKSYLSHLEDEEEDDDDQPDATPPNVNLPPQSKRVHERPVSRVAAENRNGKRVSIDQPDNNGSKTQKRARTNIVTGKQTAMSQKPPRSAQQTARSRGASRASNSSNSILDSAMNARQSSPLPMDNSHQQADTASTSPLSRRSMANSSATDWFQHQLLFAEYLEGQDEIFQVKSNLVADTQAELSLFMKHVNTEIKRGNNNRR